MWYGEPTRALAPSSALPREPWERMPDAHGPYNDSLDGLVQAMPELATESPYSGAVACWAKSTTMMLMRRSLRIIVTMRRRRRRRRRRTTTTRKENDAASSVDELDIDNDD